MPRYFFHINDEQPRSGNDGEELESLAVAKCEAVKMAGRIICDAAGEFWDRATWRMTVTDGAGLTMFALHVVGIDAPAASGSTAPKLRVS